MGYEHIRLQLDGPVGELVLARPESRNAMTEAMGAEVADAVARCNAEKGLRALVVRGEGRAFSAGGDMDMLERFTEREPEVNRRGMLDFYGLYLSIREVRVPTIAAVHGAAVGAGLCFAMACDLRVAAADAKMGVTFVRVGLHPGMGADWLLPRLVGAGRAAELLLTGRVIDAEEAHRIGLVEAVHPADELLAAARALGERVAAAAPVAVAQTKTSLLRTWERSLPEALQAEAEAQAVDYRTADVREAIAAFREKRAPSFGGR